ncbi:MAG: hypothetical protein WC594_14720, partial [Thermodesulfovibrionales bacterium]
FCGKLIIQLAHHKKMLDKNHSCSRGRELFLSLQGSTQNPDELFSYLYLFFFVQVWNEILKEKEKKVILSANMHTRPVTTA